MHAGDERDRPFSRGREYVLRGLDISRLDRRAYLLAVLAFSAPSLIAALLATDSAEPETWRTGALLGLPWITIVLGAVVVMVQVAAHAHGARISLGRATWIGLTWTPRYLWTNAHTSLVFWVPTTVLLTLRVWLAEAFPAEGALGMVVAPMWWAGIAAIAVAIHTRTLLAPFLAVHGDLPGTLAALEAWRLSGRHFALCLGTFLFGTLPVAVPLALVGLVGASALLLSGTSLDILLLTLPNLLWIGIQAVRPLLIPAAYVLYHDLWEAERARREREGEPPLPLLAKLLLALTRQLPELGRPPR